MLRSSALFRHYPTRSSTALSQLRLSPCLLSCHLNDNHSGAAAKRSFHSQVLSSIHQQQSSSHQQQNECAQVPPVTTTTTPTKIQCQLYFGPRNNPITLNNITSVHQLKQRAGQWLNVQDLSKIRLVRLPPQTRTSAAASKSSSSTKNVVELTETEKLLSGLMRPPSQYMLDEHVDHSGEQSSSSAAVLNELNGRDVQVLVEMPFKIRNALYTDGPYDIYVHDIYDVNDLSRALELYAPWTHRMKYVKFAYVEGYGPDYVGGENDDPSQRVLISRDESARSLQDRNMCAKFLEMAGKGRTFEMVCLPNTNRRLLTSLALIVVLGLDIVLYCYVLP